MFLSHNVPFFLCNIAITNFLVSHTCEIRFHDGIGQALCICIPTQQFKNMADLQGQMSMFWTLIFQFNTLDSINVIKRLCHDLTLSQTTIFRLFQTESVGSRQFQI